MHLNKEDHTLGQVSSTILPTQISGDKMSLNSNTSLMISTIFRREDSAQGDVDTV